MWDTQLPQNVVQPLSGCLSVWVHHSLRGIHETINSRWQNTVTGTFFFSFNDRKIVISQRSTWIKLPNNQAFSVDSKQHVYSWKWDRLLILLLICLFFCMMLCYLIQSNTISNTICKCRKSLRDDDNGGGKQQKQDISVFSLWLPWAFLTLLFSVHAVACVQSNCQSGRGACGWHSNTGSQHFSARDGWTL